MALGDPLSVGTRNASLGLWAPHKTGPSSGTPRVSWEAPRPPLGRHRGGGRSAAQGEGVALALPLTPGRSGRLPRREGQEET